MRLLGDILCSYACTHVRGPAVSPPGCCAPACAPLQVHSGNLQAVLDIVLSHQGVALKTALMQRLMSALVLPAPEHYRALLRRLAALSGGQRQHGSGSSSGSWLASGSGGQQGHCRTSWVERAR